MTTFAEMSANLTQLTREARDTTVELARTARLGGITVLPHSIVQDNGAVLLVSQAVYDDLLRRENPLTETPATEQETQPAAREDAKTGVWWKSPQPNRRKNHEPD